MSLLFLIISEVIAKGIPGIDSDFYGFVLAVNQQLTAGKLLR